MILTRTTYQKVIKYDNGVTSTTIKAFDSEGNFLAEFLNGEMQDDYAFLQSD